MRASTAGSALPGIARAGIVVFMDIEKNAVLLVIDVQKGMDEPRLGHPRLCARDRRLHRLVLLRAALGLWQARCLALPDRIGVATSGAGNHQCALGRRAASGLRGGRQWIA